MSTSIDAIMPFVLWPAQFRALARVDRALARVDRALARAIRALAREISCFGPRNFVLWPAYTLENSI